MRRWIPLYTALLLMLVGTHVSASGRTSLAADTGLHSKLEAQVRVWAEALSTQPQFHAWKEAQHTIVPIGPGQHGWLVTFHIGRKTVGYMIVNATQDGGFSLGEYGVGAHPAFDPNTLYQSLVRQGFFLSYSDAIKKPLRLEREYVHPLLAVWKWYAPDGQTYYLDAFTGENLPIDHTAWAKQSEMLRKINLTPAVVQLSGARSNDGFDPYERMPWLTQSPLSASQIGRLTAMIDHKAEIRFTVELYDQTVRFVWPAVGYHRWNEGAVYIAFEQSGFRYVPLDTIAANGHFYR
jgi:hypothetical protein